MNTLDREHLIRQIEAEKSRRSLAYFVERTTKDTWGNNIKLHDWQRNNFIPLLSAKPSGNRLRFHAPPQYGKSIIMSKRFPLWLLINDPMQRVVIVTYNQDFANAFYDALKSAVSDVQDLFPEFKLTGNLSAGLVTGERKALNDGSASIVFATIETGFTGKGCDIVIIDDPYRGLEDAMSPSYRRLVESFFDNKLFPRTNEKTDIYLMYHAWAEGDIGDFAVKKYGFLPVRFAAVADGKGHDPTDREMGDLLSPMRSREFLSDLESREPKMFAAMYQGIPIAEGERVFESWMFEERLMDAKLIPKLSKWHRGWDTAYTTGTGSDHSASVMFAFDQHENLHLRGFVKKRVPLNEITNWAAKIARQDPPNTDQIIEKHNAGYAVYEYLRRQPGLAPFVVMQRVTGSEGKLRARIAPFADMAYSKRVFIYKEGAWQEFLDELYAFTGLISNESDDMLAALAVGLIARKEGRSKSMKLSWRDPYKLIR